MKNLLLILCLALGASQLRASTPTSTVSPTDTPTVTPTNTLTDTLTVTSTPTNTRTDTPTFSSTRTVTRTDTPTTTPTSTITVTWSITKTSTITPTNTPTPTFTQTATPTFTSTITYSSTRTITRTFSTTSTITTTFTYTMTPTFTPTMTPKAANVPQVVVMQPNGTPVPVPNIFKPVLSKTVAGLGGAVWVPPLTKRARFLGFTLMGSVTGDYVLVDNATGNTLYAFSLAANVPMVSPPLGNGILGSGNGVTLTVRGPALTATPNTVSGTFFGTEE